MCGIVGMIVDKNPKDTRKFIWQGLYLDALRGWDSTGLVTVDQSKKITINKRAMAAQDFLDLKRVDDQIENHSNRVFIGHNRAATRGAVIHENSHPFQHDHITMVHNGSLVNTTGLPDNHRFDVDSEALAYSISKIGYKETLKKANGAFALVWYDSDKERVFMVRNGQRPLYYATIEKENMVMYASEKGMLTFLINRAGYKVEDMHELPVKTVISFDPYSKVIKDHTTEEMEFHTYPTYNYGRTHPKNRDSFPYYSSGSKECSSKKEKGKEIKTQAGEVREFNVAKMFEEVGIKKGERLQCCMYEFRPYKSGNQGFGVWEGSTCHEPYITVMSYGTTKDTYEVGEVYSLETLSMQVTSISNHPKVIKEHRAIMDHLSSHIVSEDEFMTEIERKDDEAADKQRRIEYNEKNTTIILASEQEEWPTIEQQSQALLMQIPLKGFDGKRKTKVQLVREIRFGQDTAPIYTPLEKKDTLHLPVKVDEGVNDGETEEEIEFIYVQGPRGPITLGEYKKLTGSGCSHCGGNIFTKDADNLDWWGEQGKEPICPACVEEWFEANDTTKLH